MNLAALDWVVLALLLLSLLIGAWRGLVHEVLSLLGWVAAYIAAQLYAAPLGQLLPLEGFSQALRYAIGFALCFILTAFAAGLLTWLMKKLIESVGLRPVDRALGALFGLTRGIVIALAASTVLLMTPLKESAWWKEAISGQVLSASLRGIRPILPAELSQYIEP